MKFKSNSHYQKTQCSSHVLFGKVYLSYIFTVTFLILCESLPNDIWAANCKAPSVRSQDKILWSKERFGNIGFTTRNALHLHTFACVYAVPYINCQSTMYCINYTLLILTVAGFYNAIVENCTILFQLFILKEKSESTQQIDTELCTQATINNRFD